LAAIPIVHGRSLYGVIGIHSARPDAFTEREQDIVGQLGEVVGHAVAAVDRKRALTSDETIELEFRLHDVEALDLAEVGDGRIVFDRAIPLGDGSYLQYGTATGDMMEAIERLVDAEFTPHAGPLQVVETNTDETRFEHRLAEPSVVSKAAAEGGYFDEARFEDGTYDLRVLVPPGSDVRAVVDAVMEQYPRTELVTRRQTTRSETGPRQVKESLADRLTERQRAALEASYRGGFFELPRSNSGEDIADSLDISTSTFHQHLRKAERKLLSLVLDGT